jgi:trehalose synthase
MKRSAQLEQYRAYIGEEVVQTIYEKAEKLQGVEVLHFNTTRTGGGVAEILEGLDPMIKDFGIQHKRKIIQLDEYGGHFTTHVLNLLQGNEPGDIPADERERFINWLRQNTIPQHEHHADIYFVHDFQLVPLAHLHPWMKPAAWFCHIDTAHPNPHAKRYILDFLQPYALGIFNTEASVFPELPAHLAHVMTLGIDPFRQKNARLDHAHALELLQQCGIDVRRPLITQVARYDRWKNPWQAIDIYRLVKKRMPSVQLAFVGAMEATDDKGAVHVLHELERYAQGDRDIHFLSDPAVIRDDEVNAFQRYSSVILQRSAREGFGLTVTEAMWKYQPVVGTTATGFKTQIREGENGYRVDDTQSAVEHVLALLQQRELWQRLGKQAHEQVRKYSLLPMMLLDYLDALEKIQAHSAQNGSSACVESVAD